MLGRLMKPHLRLPVSFKAKGGGQVFVQNKLILVSFFLITRARQALDSTFK